MDSATNESQEKLADYLKGARHYDALFKEYMVQYGSNHRMRLLFRLATVLAEAWLAVLDETPLDLQKVEDIVRMCKQAPLRHPDIWTFRCQIGIVATELGIENDLIRGY